VDARCQMFELPDFKKVQLAPYFLLIILFPLMALTLSELLLSYFGDPTLSLEIEGKMEYDPVTELTGRYKFLAAFLFYATLGTMLTLIFLGELVLSHTRQSILYAAVAFVLTVPAAMVFSFFEPSALKSFEAYQLLGGDFVISALGPGHVPLCTLETAACGDISGFHAMKLLTGYTNNIAEITSTAVVIGMILALARPAPAPQTPEGRVRALHYSQTVMKRYLYFAGLLLSAGMIMNVAWMSWPGTMITDPELSKNHAELVKSISLYRGVSYSLLILSYYLPVSLILTWQINTLHDTSAEEESKGLSDALKKFKVERINSIEALKATIAILSPILASGIGTLVDPTKFL